jgi:hypothetical protein
VAAGLVVAACGAYMVQTMVGDEVRGGKSSTNGEGGKAPAAHHGHTPLVSAPPRGRPPTRS